MSPEVKFSNQVIEKTKKKQGVYAILDRPTKRKEFVASLSVHVTEIVRVSFMEYARAHGCKIEDLGTEWRRFEKFLKKNL